MADSDMTGHFRQRITEHLVNQAHPAPNIHGVAIGHANSGAFLAAVLQGV